MTIGVNICDLLFLFTGKEVHIYIFLMVFYVSAKFQIRPPVMAESFRFNH